jgi:peptidyl-prolyl cis-trans isomerase A (cyclophilin A)
MRPQPSRGAQRGWILIPIVTLMALILPAGTAAEETGPRVLMRTELGDILIEIYERQAPITAANFLAYVDDDLLGSAHFYRVVRLDNQPDSAIQIEVIQGGLGFDAEAPRAPIEHETTARTGLRHLDGVISMARLEPGSASSEFFICVGDRPELDFGGKRNPDGQGFAAFGRVVSGMDTIRTIHRQASNGQMLVDPVVITEIVRARE